MSFYPDGLGATLGDTLVTTGALHLSGPQVWFVDSETGTDAVSPAGLNRDAPLATLAQAVSNSASGDIIVLLETHDETIASLVTVNKSLTIVGEGSSGGNPTAKLTNNQAAAGMLSITAASVRLRNIWIEENAQACSAERIDVAATGTDFEMVDCYVECGDTDDAAALVLQAARPTLRRCTFISTSTTIATRPHSAVRDDAGTLTGVGIFDCIFSDGSVGYSDRYAMSLANDVVTVRGEGVSLLLGAEVNITSAASGYFQVTSYTGGARVNW